MDDLPEPVRTFSSYAKSSEINSSLTAILKKTIDKESQIQPTPKDYLIVTDLVNPVPKIRQILNPGMAETQETIRRKKTGTKLHKFAAQWFREVEGYTEEESIIDGAFVNIPGVRGRLDSYIGESIIEFKTKDQKIGENIPTSISDIIEKYPHDLEQLVFYSAIHPNHPKVNFLVFMEAYPPQKLASYKVSINDIEPIKQILRNRIKSVNEAIEKRNDKNLGQCRYYGKNCHFETSKACICSNLKPYDMTQLLKHLQINDAPEFTSIIEAARKKVGERQKEVFFPSSILYPRQYYMRIKGAFDGYPPNQNWHFDSCLWHCVRKIGYATDDSDLSTLKNANEKVKCKFNWKKLPMSGKKEGIIVPYLTKVSVARSPPSKPSPYAMAELAIVCGLYDRPRGLVFVMYPNLEKLTHVYEVKFDNLSEIRKEINLRLIELDEAIEKNDPSTLPELPSFMKTGK